MNKNQKGFSAVEGLLILVAVGLVGFVGWHVWQSRNKPSPSNASQTLTQSSQNQTETEPTWLSYKNEEAKLTFQYPETWKSEVTNTTRFENGEFGGVDGVLTSPAGNKLTWIFQIIGGKGGECDPTPTDQPFVPGNKCYSKQILSVEKAQSIKPSVGTASRTIFEDSLYITRTKYMDSDDKTSYQICLDPFYEGETSNHHDETPQVGTRMGLLFPCDYWSTGFNAKFEVKDEAGFKSADAKLAEQIMRTFNSL